MENNISFMGTSLVGQIVNNPPAMQKTRFDPWVGKIPWRREWHPTPVFLPGEFHGVFLRIRDNIKCLLLAKFSIKENK